MADAAAAGAQVRVIAETVPPAPGAQVQRGPSRAERRAAAVGRLQGRAAEPAEVAAAPEVAPAPAPALAPAKPVQAPAVAAPAAAAPAAAAKPIEPPAPEKPDPAADRGLRMIEQERKKLLDEKNAWKTERELQLAELAQLRKQAEGKLTSSKDLEGLKPKDLITKFSHYTNEDWHALSRLSYAITSEGKADPRAAEAARDAERALGGRAAAAEVEQLKATIEELRAELRGEFTRRDQASFAERWVGEAVKAIPTDTPTFLSKQYANKPDATRRELLLIGAELEKENGGEAPTQAEVIAEFEKRKRESLTAMGLDPDALLAPPKPAPAPAPAPRAGARTLDVSAPAITRPENAPKTREEKRAIAIANLRARQRATADQT